MSRFGDRHHHHQHDRFDDYPPHMAPTRWDQPFPDDGPRMRRPALSVYDGPSPRLAGRANRDRDRDREMDRDRERERERAAVSDREIRETLKQRLARHHHQDDMRPRHARTRSLSLSRSWDSASDTDSDSGFSSPGPGRDSSPEIHIDRRRLRERQHHHRHHQPGFAKGYYQNEHMSLSSPKFETVPTWSRPGSRSPEPERNLARFAKPGSRERERERERERDPRGRDRDRDHDRFYGQHQRPGFHSDTLVMSSPQPPHAGHAPPSMHNLHFGMQRIGLGDLNMPVSAPLVHQLQHIPPSDRLPDPRTRPRSTSFEHLADVSGRPDGRFRARKVSAGPHVGRARTPNRYPPRPQPQYNKVHVLILTWSFHDLKEADYTAPPQGDYTSLEDETRRLRGTFESYGDKVHEYLIPMVRSAESVRSKVRQFCRYASDDTLLIVYYHGHGSLDDDNELVFSR